MVSEASVHGFVAFRTMVRHRLQGRRAWQGKAAHLPAARKQTEQESLRGRGQEADTVPKAMPP